MKILVPSAHMISKQKWGLSWRCAEGRGEGERWLRKYFSWISTPLFFFWNGLSKEECVTQHSIQYASLRSCFLESRFSIRTERHLRIHLKQSIQFLISRVRLPNRPFASSHKAAHRLSCNWLPDSLSQLGPIQTSESIMCAWYLLKDGTELVPT